MASGFYKFIKMLEYETANPGQDKDEGEQAPDVEKGISSGTAGAGDFLGRGDVIATILNEDPRQLESNTMNSIPPPTSGPIYPVAKVPTEPQEK